MFLDKIKLWPTPTTTYEYDDCCCTASLSTNTTTINHYDSANSLINTAKTTATYNYDDICDLHPVKSRSNDKATYADSNVYYYGYRYYSPTLGRWVSRDPIGEEGELNRYVFVKNNGVNTLDRLGLISIQECKKESKQIIKNDKKLLKLYRRLRKASRGGTPCLNGIDCLCCYEAKDAGGYYAPPYYGYHPKWIIICAQGPSTYPGTDDIKTTLLHELQHADDWCFENYDFEEYKDCLHSEIRAFYCSRECNDLDSCVEILKDRGYFSSCPCSDVSDTDDDGSIVDEIEDIANSYGEPEQADCAYPRPPVNDSDEE
jgi:RHS repeat-associated protein